MTNRFRIAASLVLAGAAVAAVGCSSSSSSAPTTTTAAVSTTNAAGGTANFECGVADTAAVTAVLGTLPQAERQSAKGINTCLWYATPDNYAAVNLATVGMFSRNFNAAKTNGTPVRGIGDEAYITKNAIAGDLYSAAGRTLWVRSDLLVYAISVQSTKTPEPTEAQLKAIAAPFVK